MPSPRLPALLCCLAVVLAGCNAAVPGDRQSTATPTPAPVPNQSTDAPAQQLLAPGLGERGVVDPETLAAAHNRTLRNRSFTARSRVVARFPNGTVYVERTSIRRVAAGGQTLRLDARFPRLARGAIPHERTQLYYDGEDVALRFTYENGTTERSDGNFSEAFLASLARTEGRSIERVLEGATTHVAGSTTGPTRYRVGVSNADTTVRLHVGEAGTARNRSMQLVVAPDGVVHGVRTTYTSEVGDERIRVVSVLRFEAIGETTVAPPDWANRSSRATARP